MTKKLSEDWFRELHESANEVYRLQQTAHDVLDQRSAERFDGLGHLLWRVLPSDSKRIERVANALGIAVALLTRLRASELDPIHVPLPALATLGQILELSEEAFEDLVWRDHERFAELAGGAVARSGELDADDLRADLRDAWARAAADDPANA